MLPDAVSTPSSRVTVSPFSMIRPAVLYVASASRPTLKGSLSAGVAGPVTGARR